MNSNRTYRRKMLNFSIKREMQFRMIGKIFLLLFVSLLLSNLIFYYFANQEVTSSFQLFHVKALNFLDFLLPVILSSFAISLVVGAFGSLFFPLQIVGGIHRIESDLQKVIDSGDLTLQIKLREDDQVDSLANQINLLLNNLREKVGTISRGLEQVEHSLAKEVVDNNPDRLSSARKTCNQLRDELKQMIF